MNYKEFIQKYEELLNSGYCECNELNCLDNNPPKKILNIMKEQQQEIERLNNIINEFDSWLKEKKEQMEEFELYKRKETGAFWYSTMGNIETFIEKIKELKGVDKE